MQSMIGRAACCQQADHGIHNGFLVDNIRQSGRRVAIRRQRGGLRGRRFGQRVAQGRIGRNKCRARHMQSHEFHQHLIGIGSAVKCAGSGAVIAVTFGLQ